MPGRLDTRAVVRLARRDLPRPVDVLNLIHLRDERSYARYGLAVSPALAAVGGKLRWMGAHERSLAGSSQAERLMIVRYPSHRRMLGMVFNPYYIAINRFRERGVRSFEAAFTHPQAELGELREQRWLLFAHYDDPVTLPDLRRTLEPQVGALLYASRQVAAIDILRGLRPTDPNPLTYPRVAAFAAREDVQVGNGVPPGVSLQLYRRGSPRALLAKAR